MLHQPIAEDPDLRDAIELFRPTVLEIRRVSAQMFEVGRESRHYPDLQTQLDDLVGQMSLRCDRLQITLDDLFRQVNDDLVARPPAQPFRPHGDFLATMVDENNRAYAAEQRIHREITTLQTQLKRATVERLEADRACAGYLAGWAARA